MATRFGRKQRKLLGAAARKRRLTILPKADKLWLLAGTAIITGAVMWPTHPALADCAFGTNFLSCQDVPPNGAETDPTVFEAIDDGFEVDVGDSNTVGTITVDDAGAPALTVTSDSSVSGAPFSGTVTITPGSTVEHTTSGGVALYVHYVDEVTVTNNGTIQNSSTPGQYSAVYATDFNDLTINNNGSILGNDGAGIQGFDGGAVHITNTSPATVLGVFAGVDMNFIGAFDYANSGGVTIGYDGFYSGQGIDLRDVRGDELVDDQYLNGDLIDGDQADDLSVLIVNYARVDEVHGLLGGGMILGGEDGIYIDDVWNGDVLIANQGYWDEATEEELLENPDQPLVFRDGGLIVGEDDDGVDINGVDGRVFVYNNNTQNSVALRGETLTDGLVLEFLSDMQDYGDTPTGLSAGIWGDDNGVTVDGEDADDNEDSTRYVGIYNINGLIGGRDTDSGDGLDIFDIEGEDPAGGLEPGQTAQAIGVWNGAGGMLWGGDDGVDLLHIDGDIFIDNAGSPGSSISSADYEVLFGTADPEYTFAGGNIYGEDNGIVIRDVDDGNVEIRNALGSIVGWGEDGIQIHGVYGQFQGIDGENGLVGGNVAILNGDYRGYNGGSILGEDSAISIGSPLWFEWNQGFVSGYEDGAQTAYILNGEGGLIVGSGGLTWWGGQQPWNPTIYLHLSSESGLGYDDEDDDAEGPDDDLADDIAAGLIVNNGVIANHYLPTLWWDQDGVAPGEQYEWGNEDDVMRADFASFQQYVVSGGSKSLLGGSEHDLSEYGYAASGLAVWAAVTPTFIDPEGGAVDLYNNDVLVGNVWLHGYNETDGGSGNYISNSITNNGTWLVRGEDGIPAFFGMEPYLVGTYIDGAGNEDIITNNGWIQAAFEDTELYYTGSEYIEVQAQELTFFFADYFDNFNYSGEDPTTGLISMVDGAGGDEVYIAAEFYGPNEEQYDAGNRSYVAMDVFLQDDMLYSSLNNGEYASDFFHVGEDAFGMRYFDAHGTTGLIVRRVNEDTVNGGGIIGASIHVASVDGEDEGACVDDFCKVGDTFYIAQQSDGYFESKQGTGFIEDGLFAWGLTAEAYDGIYGYEDSDYYLVGMAGPGAINAPKVATGALEIADEIFDVVHDHNYGYQFNNGGGGADLPVEAPVYEAPVATGTQTGLWAKATGSNTDRDDSVSFSGNDFDSGYDQQIYTILGGADMKWSPDSPWRMGVFGGYVTSSMDFDLGDGDVDYEGGTVGTYLAYNNGAFYVDGTVKAEFLSADYSFDNSDVDADVTNVGVSANTGYRFVMGNSYVEPLASFRYVHADVDDFDGGGGSVEYSNADSLKAGAGARIGTAFQTGAATTELSLLGRVWNEFDGDSKVTVSDGVNSFTYKDDISGVYGEVAGTVLVTSGDGTLSGFLTANGEFGDDYTKYGAKVGVRKGF